MSAISRRRLLQSGAAASMLAASAGFSRASPVAGGTLRISGQADTPPDRLIAPFVFDTLTQVGAGGALHGGLALAWRAEEGGARWRFTLNPAAAWHDGSPVRAGQIAEALGAGASIIPALAAIEGVGETEVILKLDTAVAGLPFILADPRLALRHPDAPTLGTAGYRATANEVSFERVLPSAGPFDQIEYISLNGARAGRDALLDGRSDLFAIDDSAALSHRRVGLRHAVIDLERLEILADGPGSDAVAHALKLGLDRPRLLQEWSGGFGKIAHDHPVLTEPMPNQRHIQAATSALAERGLKSASVTIDAAMIPDPATERLLRALVRDARAIGLRLTSPSGAAPLTPRLTLRTRPMDRTPEAALWAARDGGFEACVHYQSDLATLLAGGDSTGRAAQVAAITQRLATESRIIVPAIRERLALCGPRIQITGNLRDISLTAPRAA
ncbi:MAG: hypothetical protein AAF771_10525 [Pseudomonadota bacterium]